MAVDDRQSVERRPLRSRDVALFQSLARLLNHWHVSPNAISLLSVVLACGAAAALASTPWVESSIWQRVLWLTGALLIQGRLLANMLDGMVAVESGRASALGELFNEIPDRISDPLILIGAGYAVGGGAELGYIAAACALFVAYIRAIGANVGAGQRFEGPMAKPHRMFVLTLVSVYCGLAPMSWQPIHTSSGMGVMAAGLIIVIGGCVATVWRRLIRIVAHCRGASH